MPEADYIHGEIVFCYFRNHASSQTYSSNSCIWVISVKTFLCLLYCLFICTKCCMCSKFYDDIISTWYLYNWFISTVDIVIASLSLQIVWHTPRWSLPILYSSVLSFIFHRWNHSNIIHRFPLFWNPINFTFPAFTMLYQF